MNIKVNQEELNILQSEPFKELLKEYGGGYRIDICVNGAKRISFSIAKEPITHKDWKDLLNSVLDTMDAPDVEDNELFPNGLTKNSTKFTDSI